MPSLDEKYKAAHDAHALYDNLSLAIVTAMIVTAGGAYTIADKIPHGYLVYLSVVLVLIVLQIIYFHLATFASVARSVAASIEKQGESADGISTVYLDKTLFKQHRKSKDAVYYSVLVMNILLCVGMVVLAWLY